MPGGTPDYGQNLASNPTMQTWDNGEDASRLLMGGGSNSRAGRWLWASGFENGLGEFYKITSTEPVRISNNITYQGAASCQLTTSAIVGNLLRIGKVLFTPVQSGAVSARVGIEAMVFPDITVGRSVEFEWWVSFPLVSSNESYFFKIIFDYDGATAKLYTDNNGVRTLIADVTAYLAGTSTQQFHYTKLVVDGRTNQYIRFTFDDLIFDLGNAPGFIQAGLASGTGVGFFFRWSSQSPFAQTVYIDNVILTADEP